MLNFPALFLDGALGLLLYIGAVQVDVGVLVSRKWTIFALATLGTALATLLMAGASGEFSICSPFRFVRLVSRLWRIGRAH